MFTILTVAQEHAIVELLTADALHVGSSGEKLLARWENQTLATLLAQLKLPRFGLFQVHADLFRFCFASVLFFLFLAVWPSIQQSFSGSLHEEQVVEMRASDYLLIGWWLLPPADSRRTLEPYLKLNSILITPGAKQSAPMLGGKWCYLMGIAVLKLHQMKQYYRHHQQQRT